MSTKGGKRPREDRRSLPGSCVRRHGEPSLRESLRKSGSTGRRACSPPSSRRAWWPSFTVALHHQRLGTRLVETVVRARSRWRITHHRSAPCARLSPQPSPRV